MDIQTKLIVLNVAIILSCLSAFILMAKAFNATFSGYSVWEIYKKADEYLSQIRKRAESVPGEWEVKRAKEALAELGGLIEIKTRLEWAQKEHYALSQRVGKIEAQVRAIEPYTGVEA